jgi:hypothetical protein
LLHFGIPVKSKAVSKDWDQVGRLLSNTLRSLAGQLDADFRVIVAHHERPAVDPGGDPRFEFLQVDFPPPLYRQEMMVDKNRKRELIAHRLRQSGGGYLMYVDADDLVSNRIAQFVARDRNPNGYVIDTGYELDASARRVRWAPRFDRFCGTSSIIHWSVEDLPEIPFAPAPVRLRRYLDAGHAGWASLARAEGRPLKALPFPGAVYVVNTGENHSVATSNVGFRRSLLRRFTPRRAVTAAMQREFAIPDG